MHGAGFAGYLRSLFMDDITVPLLGFNVGIELGQIVVLSAAAALYVAVDGALHRLPRRANWPDAFQLRVISVSATIAIIATGWAAERFPR